MRSHPVRRLTLATGDASDKYIQGKGRALADRNTHLQHAATYVNIAAGGTFVGALVTVPLASLSTGKIDSGQSTGLVIIFVIGSFFLHGVAQAILAQVRS
jgi:hypothetical protein